MVIQRTIAIGSWKMVGEQVTVTDQQQVGKASSFSKYFFLKNKEAWTNATDMLSRMDEFQVFYDWDRSFFKTSLKN